MKKTTTKATKTIKATTAKKTAAKSKAKKVMSEKEFLALPENKGKKFSFVPATSGKVTLTENTAVRIWDALNEAALACPSKAWKTHTKKLMERLEKALKDAGLGVPMSDHGHA